jgi:hypothetical protein
MEYFMLLKARYSLLLLLLLPTQSKPSLSKDLSNAATVLALAGATYLAGRGCSAVIHYVAAYKYQKHIALLAHAQNNPQWCYPSIKADIIAEHVKQNVHGPYRHYPLLQYVRNIDSVINMLFYWRIFHLGTEKWYRICELLDQLCTLKTAVLSDHDFITERQKFERTFQCPAL